MYIPIATAKRLPAYLDFVRKWAGQGNKWIKSVDIAAELSVASSTVRRDLSFVADEGTKGFGFNVTELEESIEKAIGQKGYEPIAIIGMGKMGRALTGYNMFDNQAGKIVCGFDTDPKLVGTKDCVIPILCMNDLEKTLKEQNIRMVILATPPKVVEELYQKLVKMGVKAFINFSGYKITRVPSNLSVENIDVNTIVHNMIFNLKK